MNKFADYNLIDIKKALLDLNIKPGDKIFIHSNIGFFGKYYNIQNAQSQYMVFKEAIFNIIGKKGTLCLPSFSYSFCSGNKWDIKNTPSVCGYLSEMALKDNESIRSNDANFSVVAIGNENEIFTKNIPEHSFGKGSFWERFYESDGIICNFNIDSRSTFMHFVEKSLNVHYRYDKEFVGIDISSGSEINRKQIHFVRDLNSPNTAFSVDKFEQLASKRGFISRIRLGRGLITKISAKNTFKVIEDGLNNDPAFLIVGPTVPVKL